MEKLFTEEHEMLRQSVRKFVEREIIPNIEEWEVEGDFDHSLFRKLGDLGFLGIQFPEEYGGSAGDFLSVIVFCEELSRSGASGVSSAVSIHTTMATPPIDILGTHEQKLKFLVPAITGERIGALGITEPNAGSDVAAIQTTAVRDGDSYVVNGSKTFISNGSIADQIALAVKTDKKAGYKGVTMLMIEKGTPGFSVGRKLVKMGYHSGDLAELVFEDCRVPTANRLGDEGQGFYGIMKNFEEERLIAAASSVARAGMALELAVTYAKERHAFGRPISKFQVNAHKLAEMATEIEAARQLTYSVVAKFNAGEQCQKEIAMAKYFAAETANRVAYRATQIFGGYGYMREYPIERIYRDVRALTIAGGTTEIMKEIIARRMGL